MVVRTQQRTFSVSSLFCPSCPYRPVQILYRLFISYQGCRFKTNSAGSAFQTRREKRLETRKRGFFFFFSGTLSKMLLLLLHCRLVALSSILHTTYQNNIFSIFKAFFELHFSHGNTMCNNRPTHVARLRVRNLAF